MDAEGGAEDLVDLAPVAGVRTLFSRFAETGTHTELLGLGGRYADLYRLHHPPQAPEAQAIPSDVAI